MVFEGGRTLVLGRLRVMGRVVDWRCRYLGTWGFGERRIVEHGGVDHGGVERGSTLEDFWFCGLFEKLSLLREGRFVSAAHAPATALSSIERCERRESHVPLTYAVSARGKGNRAPLR